MNIIEKQSDHLNSIIEDMLSLSVIEHLPESDSLSKVIVDIDGVIFSAVAKCESMAYEREISIVTIPSDNLFVEIESVLFQRALINLLNNAISYSRHGETVTIGAKSSKTEISIYVKDTGCGIDEFHLPRLFERFYRVDPDRAKFRGGTGLGLAIVKHIALAHGGRVSVESRLGQGSTFWIHLPSN